MRTEDQTDQVHVQAADKQGSIKHVSLCVWLGEHVHLILS